MQISKKSQYGLRAMVLLAKNHKAGQVLSVKTISQKEEVSFDFLEKIISDLERAGLVRGKKGAGGGYVLAKKPERITARDIVETLENTTAVECGFCGRSKKCMAKNVWKKIDGAVNKTLKSITLKDLI